MISTIKKKANYAVFLAAVGVFGTFSLISSSQAAPSGLPAAKQLGQARLTVFGFGIYDAKFWASDDFKVASYAEQDFAIELTYLRNFSGQNLAERSLKEMRMQMNVSEAQAQAWLAQMLKTFPDVKKGDVIMGTHRASGSASFTLNGKPIGEVKDEIFTRLFFGIWLSPRTTEPQMRLQLIGQAKK